MKFSAEGKDQTNENVARFGQLRHGDYPVTNDREDRRWKMLYVEPDEVLDIVQGWRNKRILTIPMGQGIPEGCRIINVRYSEDRRAFAFRLFHPSFEPVPQGERTPRLEAAEVQWTFLELVQSPDERTAMVKATGLSAAAVCTLRTPAEIADAKRLAASAQGGSMICIPRRGDLADCNQRFTSYAPYTSTPEQEASSRLMHDMIEQKMRADFAAAEERAARDLVGKKVLFKPDGSTRIVVGFSEDRKRVSLVREGSVMAMLALTEEIAPLVQTPMENSPNGVKVAIVAGLTNEQRELCNSVELSDSLETAEPKPARRNPFEKYASLE